MVSPPGCFRSWNRRTSRAMELIQNATVTIWLMVPSGTANHGFTIQNRRTAEIAPAMPARLRVLVMGRLPFLVFATGRGGSFRPGPIQPDDPGSGIRPCGGSYGPFG